MNQARRLYLNFKKFVYQNPNKSFLILLALLVALMSVGGFTSDNVSYEIENTSPKKVEIFTIGDNSNFIATAEVTSSNIYEVRALTSGFVRKINVKNGQKINGNQTLAVLSQTPSGGNAAFTQRKLQEIQLSNLINTRDTQKEIISRNRELAENNFQNSKELASIANKSLDDTRELIELNEEILKSIPETPETSAQIAAQKAALAQLKAQYRANEYQAKGDSPAAKLTNLQKEVALQQLDLQEKSLELGIDVARLQLELVRIAESAHYPSSPVSGTIEAIHVSANDLVSPNQLLFTVKKPETSITIRSNVSKSIALLADHTKDAKVKINGVEYNAKLEYVPLVPTSQTLYTLVYAVNEPVYVAKGTNVTISIPLGVSESDSIYIPLDALHISQSQNIVYVSQDNKAVAREVSMGNIAGSLIEITNGLSTGDDVILSRNVIANDEISL